MFRKFNILFTLRVFHQYSGDVPSTDFTVAPTPSGLAEMRRYGLLFRQSGDTVYVLYERKARMKAEPGAILKAIDRPVVFTFLLRLRAPYVLNYTDWGASEALGDGPPTFCFSNLDAVSGNLDANQSAGGEIRLMMSDFAAQADTCIRVRNAYRLPVSGASFQKLELLADRPGAPWEPVLTADLAVDQAEVALDLSDQPSGRYTVRLRPRDPEAETTTRQLFVDREQPDAPFFAYLQFHFDETTSYAQEREYAVYFRSPVQTWQYFIIRPKEQAGNGDNGVTYGIDYVRQNPNEPSRYPDEITFSSVDFNLLSEKDKKAVRSFSPRKVDVLQSNQLLPKVDQPLSALQLVEQENPLRKKVLIPFLPNPARQAIEPKIFINL